MKFKRYIVVVPMVGSKLDLLRFSENRYTWVSFWHDLRGLHSKCIFHEFKIFVDQPDPTSSPPELFVCTLVNAQSVEEAYKKGTENVLSLSNSLMRLLSEGFEPKYHETIVVPFHPAELPPTIEDTISVELVKLTTKNGKVEEIATPYSAYKPRLALPGKAAHEKYATTYFKIPKLESGTSEMPPIYMSPKEHLLDIEPHLEKIRAFKSNDEARLMNVVATLYSAAITTENISVSYLLLWQILESFASSKDDGGKLFNDTIMNRVRGLLQQEGYDVDTAHRVNSILGMLGKKNDIQIIAEMLGGYVFVGKSIAELKGQVDRLREIRGAIVHPKVSLRLDANKLMVSYKELRDIVDKLVRKLR